MEEKNVNEIINEIKGIDNNVTNVLIPILKDTIIDYKKIVFKLILIIALSIISLVLMSAYSIYKYNDFLSQFEYEAETVYQEVSADEGDSVINDGIKYNQ